MCAACPFSKVAHHVSLQPQYTHRIRDGTHGHQRGVHENDWFEGDQPEHTQSVLRRIPWKLAESHGHGMHRTTTASEKHNKHAETQACYGRWKMQRETEWILTSVTYLRLHTPKTDTFWDLQKCISSCTNESPKYFKHTQMEPGCGFDFKLTNSTVVSQSRCRLRWHSSATFS